MLFQAHRLIAELLAGVDPSLDEVDWDALQEVAAVVDLAAASTEDSARSDAS